MGNGHISLTCAFRTLGKESKSRVVLPMGQGIFPCHQGGCRMFGPFYEMIAEVQGAAFCGGASEAVW